jgi:hypothetical protein
MFLTRKHLSRRTVLKGAGVSLALPFLEAMVPAATALAQTAAAPKMRAGFFYIPHGAVQGDTAFGPDGDRWTPSGSGAGFKLNTITQPLEPFKQYVSTIGNLDNPSGSGRHIKNPGSWLCCSNPAKTIDQMIADRIGQQTAHPSLQISSETTVQQAAGSGVTTAITVSFRDAGTPLRMEHDSQKVFDALFGTNNTYPSLTSRQPDSSLLDLIKESVTALQGELGAGDRIVLENYLDNVGIVEQRAQEKKAEAERLAAFGIPNRPAVREFDEFDKQVELMFDLIAIAYQADLSRVVSYVMVAEGTNKQYPFIGVNESFHPISHHANDKFRIDALVKIQTWHMAAFAKFLKKMSETNDGDGTLLDHSIFLYGSNMGNSDKHSNWPIPTVIVGGGNGKMKRGGQHVALSQRSPLANVHLTLLNKFGIEQNTFADSTGMISEL